METHTRTHTHKCTHTPFLCRVWSCFLSAITLELSAEITWTPPFSLSVSVLQVKCGDSGRTISSPSPLVHTYIKVFHLNYPPLSGLGQRHLERWLTDRCSPLCRPKSAFLPPLFSSFPPFQEWPQKQRKHSVTVGNKYSAFHSHHTEPSLSWPQLPQFMIEAPVSLPSSPCLLVTPVPLSVVMYLLSCIYQLKHNIHTVCFIKLQNWTLLRVTLFSEHSSASRIGSQGSRQTRIRTLNILHSMIRSKTVCIRQTSLI